VQENSSEARRRIEEARRLRSETLDLGDLALTELPAELRELPQLRKLFLGRVKPTGEGGEAWDQERKRAPFTDLSPLSGLTGLQRLDLLGTGVADLSPLSGLTGLQSLDLGSTGVTDLSPVSGLTGLQSLNLGITGVTDLSPLSGLTGLQSLNLGITGVTDLSPLSGLTGLQSLNLGSTGVTDLSPLSGLTGLQSLDLGRTGVTDLSALRGLTGLQLLDLGFTWVRDLSPLSGLTGLQLLDLGGAGVTDLSPLSGLTGLESLDLWRSTRVTDLSPLCGLTGLQSLVLWSTGVTDLSPLLSLDRLQTLYISESRAAIPASTLRRVSELPRLASLAADHATGVPQEVLSRNGDDCLARLRTYFSELDLGAEAEDEVKVILLGNGGVGKTQLCRRFRGEPYEESGGSTHGVRIWRRRQRLPAGGTDRDLQLNWWDFGGQDIYHGTHALFLRSRAVFLILWTPALENREESTDERGIPVRNQLLAYWLDYVRSLAGRDSPVVVVQSRCDSFADRRADPPRPAGVRFFECCAYSAKNDRDDAAPTAERRILEGHLHNALRCLVEGTGPLTIGRGRAEVRRRLYAWRSADQRIERPEERRHRTLSLDELRAVCDEAGDVVSWEHALDYLHQTGVVFYRPELFADRIILDQDWALDAIYTVFHRGRVAPLLRDSGRFTREDLALLAWQDHPPAEQTLFLGLMESCGVCFRCGETAQGEPRYVAPDLLPPFATVASHLHAWEEQPGLPTLRLEYAFCHPAVIRGLMGDVGRAAGDRAEYWRYGLWLKDAATGSQILVQLEGTSTEAAPGAGALVLRAQGRDPLGLLRAIRRTALGRRHGDEPEELLTLAGTTVARSALAAAIDGRVLDVHGQAVAAAAFAAFFASDDGKPSTPGAQGAAPMSGIRPAPPTADDKPREVFLSYAWGDDSPAGRLRAQAVDRLQAALGAEGYVPVRDRDRLRPGERISAFIRRLTGADLVVAVISDKYLRSPYCMYEIYRLWQRCQADPDELAERIVPVILPEVRIGSFEQRAPYMAFWSERAAKLAELVRDPALRPSRESWEEVRLVQEFAHHVDGILGFLNDVLMPRNLDAQFADDFAAVREAVRRLAGRRAHAGGAAPA
jgi:internalin A